MRGYGEIARLCAIAPPTIGIVTAVADAHTARLGGIEGVARAKAELVIALPPSGVAILNADDERVRAMADVTQARSMTFGESSLADVVVDRVSLDELARPSFRVHTPWGEADVRLRVSGRHMVGNAAAAIAAAGVLGVDVGGRRCRRRHRRAVGESDGGSSTDVGSGGDRRCLQRQPGIDGCRLRRPGRLPASRRIAIVGVMAELDEPADAHRAIADLAAEQGIELVAVGTDLYGVPPTERPRRRRRTARTRHRRARQGEPNRRPRTSGCRPRRGAGGPVKPTSGSSYGDAVTTEPAPTERVDDGHLGQTRRRSLRRRDSGALPRRRCSGTS